MTNTTNITIPRTALHALSILEEADQEAWLVGGFVRDAIMNRPVHDIDIAVNCPWQQTKAIFQQAGYACHETGVTFGTVTAVVEGDTFEVTTFRKDGAYRDNRHPQEVVFVPSIQDDLARRDFTINAMAYHPIRGLVDPFGGEADIQNRTLRAVGDPRKRLAEDALRIMRALRFRSILGFDIHQDTKDALVEQAHLLSHIPPERFSKEMNGLLCGSDAAACLREFPEIIAAIIPEITPMEGFRQNSKYHIYDVWEHTIHVVSESTPAPLNRWCALLHDIGKPSTYTEHPAGVGHFYGHPQVSAQMAKNILTRLRYPRRFIGDVERVVALHDLSCAATTTSVRKTVAKLGGRADLFEALCDLKIADARSKAPAYRYQENLPQDMIDLFRTMPAEERVFGHKDLAISGSDIVKLGIASGPQVGKILDELLQAVMEGRLPNRRDNMIAAARKRLR